MNCQRSSLLTLVLVLSVKGDQKNVALSKPAEQCSVEYGGTANFALDGNVDNDFLRGSCTHTNKIFNTWWKVDLLGYYTIISVKIYTRADCCSCECSQSFNVANWNVSVERLQEFEVRVSITNPTVFPSREGSLCQYRSAQVTPGGEMLNCSQPVTGRYVSIYKAANSYLTLCEVQVYADETKYFRSEAVYSLVGKNKRGNSTVLRFLTTKSKFDCTSQCKTNHQCCGLNVRVTSTKVLCELLAVVPWVTPSTYYEEGWSFYSRIK